MPDQGRALTSRPAENDAAVPFGGAQAAAHVLLCPGQPLFYRVADVMRMLALSRSVLFDELRTNRLKSVRRGRSRLVSAAAIVEYVRLLEREEAESAR